MAQVEAQTLLRLCEEAGRLCTFDLEATGLNGDYNAVLCVSIKPYHKDPIIIAALPDQQATVARKAVEVLSGFDCWISYYGKGYDVKMLRTVLLGAETRINVPRTHHLDMYFSVVASKLNTSHRSQGHVNAWLYDPEKLEAKRMQKMTVGANVWQRVVDVDMEVRMAALETLKERCMSDTIGLEGLYEKTKYLVSEVTR